MNNNGKRKINVGCGPTGQINGFVNLDNSPSILLSKTPILKSLFYKIGIISKGQHESDRSRLASCDSRDDNSLCLEVIK